MGSAEDFAREFGRIPNVEWPVGTYVEANPDGTVRIDFGLGPVTCLSAGFYQPLPGESVRVLRTDKATVLIGPAIPMSVVGQVTATGSPLITVDTSAGSKQLPYMTSYTPATSDLVTIMNNIVMGKLSAAPAGSYNPPTPVVRDFSVDFRAVDSGSYQSSWWTTQVWCSATNIGAWFYPDIAATIPDNATIRQVQVFVPEFFNQYPTSLATIGVHSMSSKSGAPSVGSAVSISAGAGWKSLPTSFGDALKTGAARGVGTAHGGYHKFRSIGEDADSGLLRIDWSV